MCGYVAKKVRAQVSVLVHEYRIKSELGNGGIFPLKKLSLSARFCKLVKSDISVGMFPGIRL